MFSGKTTELIRRLKRYQVARYSCLIIRYVNDTRYSTNGIATHDKQELPAVSASRLDALKDEAEQANVIGIDEGQFFPDCVEFSERMANLGKIVIVAALDGTFQRIGFGSILELIPLAESIVKLKAVCMVCFQDAAFTKRTTSQKEVEVIGGNDMYMSVCRKCYQVSYARTPSKFSPGKRADPFDVSSKKRKIGFNDENSENSPSKSSPLKPDRETKRIFSDHNVKKDISM